MDDLIAGMSLTKIETEILYLRLDGYTMQEIGDQLAYTKQGICKIINAMKVKVSRLGIRIPSCCQKISGTQVCNQCKDSKSFSDYYKISEMSRKGICKKCMKENRDARV